MHVLVAAYLDYKPPPLAGEAPAPASAENPQLEGLIGAVPELPEHLKPRIPIPRKHHG